MVWLKIPVLVILSQLKMCCGLYKNIQLCCHKHGPTSYEKCLGFGTTNMAGNCPKVSLKTPSFVANSMARDTQTFHQRHTSLDATNRAGVN